MGAYHGANFTYMGWLIRAHLWRVENHMCMCIQGKMKIALHLTEGLLSVVAG